MLISFLAALALVQCFFYGGGDDVDGHLVVTALGNDDIGVPLGRLDELQVHGFHGIAVVLDGGLDGASALGDVAQDDAGDLWYNMQRQETNGEKISWASCTELAHW